MASLEVRVFAPDRVVFDGEGVSVIAPAWDGLVGILPGHAAMITPLVEGNVIVDTPGGGSVELKVSGGVLRVEQDKVSILTEHGEAESSP